MNEDKAALRRWFVAAILGLAALVSGIGASFPRNTWLQVGPVLLVAVVLPWLMKRWPLSRVAWGSVVIFLLLHLFAAHWTYSDVPYENWLRHIGVDSRNVLGTSRNMFDRIVHFAFGLLAISPLVELEMRFTGVDRRLALRLAILFVLASSAAYEVFEWLLAVSMSPEAAEAYNGQQGDGFDPQKDMAMAFSGAAVSLVVLCFSRRSAR